MNLEKILQNVYVKAFGKGNYDTGPKSDYNRLKKYGDRAFTNPKK